MRRAAAALLLVAPLAACTRDRAISSCADNLHGVWTTPSGARWMLLDHGQTLEAYPLFDDSVAGGAPRLIDLRRDGALAGALKRRYMRRELECIARAPIRITACGDNTLQVVLGEVSPPLDYAPCTWGQPLPSRVETWRRE